MATEDNKDAEAGGQGDEAQLVEPVKKPWWCWHYEWQSDVGLFGYPLAHVNLGCTEKGHLHTAKGFVAIGIQAIGIITIAQFGCGIVGIGQFMLALATLAQFGIGLVTVAQFGAGVAVLAQFGVGIWASGHRTASAVD
eukprot:evm.model.scf_4330.1 EVM.evm.TU.scf_4330.1   scf_4330:588-4795(+)